MMNFYDLQFSKSLIAIQVLMRKDNEGNTPFHLAAASGDIETLDNFILYYELEIGNIEENPGKCNCSDRHNTIFRSQIHCTSFFILQCRPLVFS